MADTPPIRQARRLASFEILREIGRGGMGVVYLARQPALDRLVVLKKIRREIMADTGMLERFRLEARTAAGVHHQNVVAVYDSFPARGAHYIAQEFVEGVDLGAVLEKITRVEPAVAARIALEIARGLEEIHARGIVHRDLKPGNVLLGSGGETKIADFGIAIDGGGSGLTRPGTLVGSVPYMSPEQMLGKRVDARSDLFSFGVVLYQMLTGKAPFCGSDDEPIETLLARIEAGHYPAPDQHGVRVPRYLKRVIRGCLRDKPSRRFQSTTSVRQLLEKRIGAISPADCRSEIAAFLWKRRLVEVSGDRTAVRPLAARPSLLRRIPRRYWLPAAGAAAVLLITLAGLRFGLATDRGGSKPPISSAAAGVRFSPSSMLAPPVDTAAKPVDSFWEYDDPDAATAEVAEAGSGSEAVAVEVDPAVVRIVAYPWAEVRFEDGRTYETPHAAGITISAGRQRVVFAHPTFGTAEVELDLAPGEQRVVRHTFLAQVTP